MCSQAYRVFSIKRPRRLFQTWPGGPGVYFKPAFNRGPAFIKEVFFSAIISSFNIYYHLSSEAQAKLVKTGQFFPSPNLTKLPWDFRYSLYSIQHAYYRMLQLQKV